MKRSLLLLAAAVLFAPLLHADQTQRYIVITRGAAHEVLPRIMRDDLEPRAAAERDVREFEIVDGFAANLTVAEVAQLGRSRNVVYVEPVYERYLFSRPSKPTPLSDTISAGKETTPYGITLLNAPSVWSVGRGAARSGQAAVHIAIIDTGIDYRHPELTHA